MDDLTERLKLACEIMQNRAAQREAEIVNLTVDLIRERQKNAELIAAKAEQ